MAKFPRTEHTPPKPNKDSHSTQKPQRNWLEYVAVIAASAAVLVTAITAGVGIWQAIIASDTEKRQLRAYVGILPGDIENLGDREKQVYALTRKNYGLTPAYDLAVISFGQSVIQRNQPIVTVSQQPPPDIRGTVTLFPSAELPFRIKGVAVAQDQVDRLMKGDDMQFVYFGTVQYRDAFDQRHLTYFCWMYTRNSTTVKDAEGCLGHNDSN
jgi:hypothetical protein